MRAREAKLDKYFGIELLKIYLNYATIFEIRKNHYCIVYINFLYCKHGTLAYVLYEYIHEHIRVGSLPSAPRH